MALALGLTLGEVFALSAAEYAFWLDYRHRYGLPVDRLQLGVAMAGSAANRGAGGRARIDDLIPRFGHREELDTKAFRAYLAGLPGAKSVTQGGPPRPRSAPRPPQRSRRPTLDGR